MVNWLWDLHTPFLTEVKEQTLRLPRFLVKRVQRGQVQSGLRDS